MRASRIISILLSAGVEANLIGPNPRRVAIQFAPPLTSNYYVRTTKMGNVTGGYTIAAGTAPLILTLSEHGDIVLGEFWGESQVGCDLGIVETIQ